MQKQNKKQLVVLTLITSFATAGYLGDKFREIGENGIEQYAKFDNSVMTVHTYNIFHDIFDEIEREILKEKWSASSAFLLSFVLDRAGFYCTILKNETKLKVWNELHDFAKASLSKNFMNFPEEIEKAEDMVDLITKIIERKL